MRFITTPGQKKASSASSTNFEIRVYSPIVLIQTARLPSRSGDSAMGGEHKTLSTGDSMLDRSTVLSNLSYQCACNARPI